MEAVSVLGAILIAGIFVWSGIEHLVKFRLLTRQLANRIVAPAFLLATSSVLEIVAGVCLAIGIAKPYAAGFLIVFTAVASFVLLDFWRHSGEQRAALQNAFITNVAVVGGLLLAAVR